MDKHKETLRDYSKVKQTLELPFNIAQKMDWC